MSPLAFTTRFGSVIRFPTVLSIAAAILAAASPLPAQSAQDGLQSKLGNSMGGMAHMEGHMHMTALRPIAGRRSAEGRRNRGGCAHCDGALQGLPQGAGRRVQNLSSQYPAAPISLYELSKRDARLRGNFDPLKPTSLLYKKTSDGGYVLVGAMYTDRVGATEDELNQRIPLSMARWHQHVNFCKAPAGQRAAYFGPDAKFGLLGSIHTREACEAAGGQFIPHVFGWMVHVYPYETDPAKIWSIDDDDHGHDNMDHSAMPGMNMNMDTK